MPYQFAIDLDALFAERRPQMIGRGIPESDVNGIIERVTDMWLNGPGGWPYEWSELARSYAGRDENELALLAYGYAKFPTLADDGRRTAYQEQIELCVRVAEAGPVDFERRTVTIDYAGESVDAIVHQYSMPGASLSEAPVLLASGGVDMWKDDLNAVWGACAMFTGMSVLAFDIPGTGESTVAMSAESTAVVSGLVTEAKRLGNGRVAHFGISMGGYFAAKTGLTGEVDAAAVLGGPVTAAFEAAPVAAMASIVGSALGFDSPPSEADLAARWVPMSLQSALTGRTATTPILVVNGEDDPLIPQEDTLLFDGLAGAEAHLIPEATHCAAEKLAEVTPMIIGWLAKVMAPPSVD